MATPAVDPASEDALFAAEVAEVKRWWSGPRWRHTRRPFTAEQIVSMRGLLRIEYPSNLQARKLWAILQDRFNVKPQFYSILFCSALLFSSLSY
jgi:isocitrate lyase